MNFKYIYLLLIIFLLACNNEGDLSDSTQYSGHQDTEIGYLCVNVVAPSTGTRDGFYVGSEFENKIKSVRIYFFDKDLKAVAINESGDTYIDSVDISNDYSSDNEGNNSNIESTVTTLLLGLEYTSIPHYIAAVVNLSSPPVLRVGDNISLLQRDTYAKKYDSRDGFVMSSTVYKGFQILYDETSSSSKPENVESEIIAKYVYGSIEDSKAKAQNNPITIHVERIVAKMSASIDLKDIDGVAVSPENVSYNGETFQIYKLSSTKIDEGAPNSGTEVYIRFLGWNVTGTRNSARLIKKINIDWDNKFDGWNINWNDANNFRSYWAVNPSSGNVDDDYSFIDFNLVTSLKFDQSGNNINYTYALENAGKADDGMSSEAVNTMMITAAQLVDHSGAPLSLAKWGGAIYNFSNTQAKEDLMNIWATYSKIYKQTNSNTWETITADDIKLVATEPGSAEDAFEDEAQQRYFARLTLVDESGKYAIYKSGSGNNTILDKGDEGNGYDFDADLIKLALESIGVIKYWNSGYSYYWIDIPHYGSDILNNGIFTEGIGKYGIVRNNWYNFILESVNGLGIPVADPDKVIYPERPDDPYEAYLGVKIDILPWRYVDQGSWILGK